MAPSYSTPSNSFGWAGLIIGAVAVGYAWKAQAERRGLQVQLDTEKELKEQATSNRAAERTGRIAAEKKLKAALLKVAENTGSVQGSGDVVGKSRWSFQPLGHLESVFRNRHGTPRQGCIVTSARAKLRIDHSVIEPHGALEGLDQYSHVWLVYVFHENTNTASTIKAKITPPRLGTKVGVFSTRSPHRPNAIGLSLVRLDAVVGDTLHLSGVDLLDKTPILDVKPYIGKWDGLPDTKCPDWVVHPPILPFTGVNFNESALTELEDLVPNMVLYKQESVAYVQTMISDVLMMDVRSGHQRTKGRENEEYEVHLDNIRVVWQVINNRVLVTEVARA